MSLKVGSRLGPYEVGSLIGRGGMGEVYRARDSKLKRDVALKVLPEEFMADSNRVARFRREAEVLASLSHSHIASIYGVEEADGVPALVLELVDGATLADRIADGPIPLDEALPIASQIADALEAAHDHGVIHRDLKPGNIKLLPDGSVKVLDFGLAKIVDPVIDGSDGSQSPTITSPAMTRMGVVLGTAAYMSPEQARGKVVDTRSDIWAFGCVLYEMLTGSRAFAGDDVTDTLAFVITKEPDWTALPAATPSPVHALLRHCLQKSVRHRLRDIGDARLAIDDAMVRPGTDTPGGSVVGDTRRSGGAVLWISLPLVALTTAGVMLMVIHRDEPPAARPKRFVVQLPADHQLAFGESAPVGEGRPSLAISPDGHRLAYVGRQGDRVRLYQRPLEQFDATAIDGTEGAFNPFFSPDGQWIGFFTNTHLKKVPVSGGTPVTLCEARNPYGATWLRDSVYFAQAFGMVLSRVPAAGGSAEAVRSGGSVKFWPFAVPDDDALFVSGWPSGIQLVRLNEGKGADRLIAGTYTSARLTPTGHLILVRPGQLLAAPFDRTRWEIVGAETPVLDGVRTEPWGGGQFSFSHEGTLAYVQGAPATTGSLITLDRTGHAVSMSGFRVGNYQAFKLSPSGDRLAITVSESTTELWVHDLVRGTRTRLNATGNSGHPLWSPDGEWLTFSASVDGAWNIFRQRADGSGDASRLTSSTDNQIPYSWSPDGRVLAFTQVTPATRSDIWLVSESDRAPKPLLSSGFNEGQPAISPDGKWLAYVSDESGKSEMYVTGYPAARGRSLISIDGGEEPIWSRNGKELFYRNGQRWMVVTTSTQPTFDAGRPRLLFEGNYLNVSGLSYDVTADGQRFVLIRGVEAPPVREIHVVLNWFEELKRLTSKP
ncbi:MAG TPA: protein kinase [Vicinamibacterales bacterium]|nr:protein kinase [Vicinamibacterales bacterium]